MVTVVSSRIPGWDGRGRGWWDLRRRGGGWGQWVAKREAHRGDLLLLLDDDLLGDATELLVTAIAEVSSRHVDRALVVGDHHGGEIPAVVAARLHRHSGHHAGPGGRGFRPGRSLQGPKPLGGGGAGRGGRGSPAKG